MRAPMFQGFLIVAVVLAACAAESTDHYVSTAGTNNSPYLNWPDAATNIQWAVNVATNGEKVWVTNGTYNLTNQILITNGITVQSCDGKTQTFINGNYPTYSNRCFYLSNTAAVVDGFTISNGYLTSDGWLGGGVRIFAGTVRNCSIVSNTLAGNGLGVGCPGVYMVSGSCVLSNCLVAFNGSVTAGNVGGVRVENGLVDGCHIVSNTGNSVGGIYMVSGTSINSTSEWNTVVAAGAFAVGITMVDGLVSNCLIRNIFGTHYGIRMSGGTFIDSVVSGKTVNEDRGLYLGGGNVVNCTINNSGGGVYGTGGTMSNCTITGNTPYGGVTMAGNGFIMRSCLVSSNTSVANGGGVDTFTSTTGLVENCTMVKNHSNKNGGGVSVGTSGGTVNNCVIYLNTASGLGQNWCVSNSAPASFTNCCTTPTNDLPGSGNISNNPAFVNSAGDSRVSRNSPCINQGLTQAWMTDALDLDRKRRVDKFSGRVDIGAYEFILRGTLLLFR